MAFSGTSSRNLVAADPLPASAITWPCRSWAPNGCWPAAISAQLAQENLIKASSGPLHDRAGNAVHGFRRRHLAQAATVGEFRLPPALMQPIASEDVAAFVAETAARRADEWHGRSGRTGTDPPRRSCAAVHDSDRRLTDGCCRFEGVTSASRWTIEALRQARIRVWGRRGFRIGSVAMRSEKSKKAPFSRPQKSSNVVSSIPTRFSAHHALTFVPFGSGCGLQRVRQ